jgi:signal transduction histidine kinase
MADLLAMKMQAAEAQELRAALCSQASQIAEARRVSALAETAAGIAHDFNNLLSVMLSSAELIATDPNASPEIIQLARHIATAGLRGEALARGLIEFSQPVPRSSRIVRPADVISSALDLLNAAAGQRHTVDLEIRSCAGRVLIDPHQLERVVLNLVVNARDAMPEGGAISLVVDTGSEAQLGTARGEYAIIAVSDSGVGIPPAVLSRIFDPFFTTKPKGHGTGVGLAVVQQVANYAGGFVRVESSIGEGTTFRVYLPRASCS